MIKTDLIVAVTMEKLLAELNGAIAVITAENGDSSIISISHAHANERLPKFSALITFKAKP